MSIRELRILSGLQAGARLTVSERSYVIGQSDECDVLVVGHGIDATALQLAVSPDAIIATPLQPGCGFALTDSMTEPFSLSLGQAFRLGDLWLCVDEKEAPWPPPQSWLPTAKPPEPSTDESAKASALADGDREHAVTEVIAATRRRYWHWFAMLGIGLLLCGGAVHLLQPAAPVSTITAAPSPRPLHANRSLLTPVPVAASVAKQPVSPLAPIPATPAFDAVEEFKTQLVEHQLARHLQITLEGTVMRITGELDSAQSQKFEALLVPFTKKYGDTLTITAHFPSPASHLPFHIRQVVSGHPAHVVTNDGTRIFEGGSFHGYRLVSITDRKVIFAGRRSVELEW